jgi:uncharacterized protein (DUF2236 family)
MVWRVNGDVLTALGGGRALLMQIAHPLVAAGVADHSDFEANAFARLWRTLDSALTVAFGDREQVSAVSRRVAGIHSRVTGRRGDLTYAALDPELLLWVHATLVDSALVAYERFVAPLSGAERERYYEEMKAFAAAFSVPAEVLPSRLVDFDRYLDGMVSHLEVSDEARRLAGEILRPPVPLPFLPLGGALALVTAGLLPGRLRVAYGLPWSPARAARMEAATRALRLARDRLPRRALAWPHVRAAWARLGPS